MKIDKERWKGGDTVQGMARIPTHQVYFLFWAAMLGAMLFVGGILWAGRSFHDAMTKVPPALLVMIIGFFDFTLFLPLSYIIILAKELQKTRDRVEELAGRQSGPGPVTQP